MTDKEAARKRALDHYYRNRDARLEAVKNRHNRLKDTPAYKASRKKTQRKNYELNKVKIAAYRKSRAHIHKAYAADWFQKNKASLYARIKDRMKSDEQFVAARRCRGRLNGLLARLKSPKAGHTMDLVGCTATLLVQHLKRATSRSLHDSEVDHIFPVSLYDLTQPEQQRRCFHFSNLQLLSSEENKLKSDQLPAVCVARSVERWAWPDGIDENDLC